MRKRLLFQDKGPPAAFPFTGARIPEFTSRIPEFTNSWIRGFAAAGSSRIHEFTS